MCEKAAVYEMHIEDMLHVIKDRLDAYENIQSMSEFEQGRYLAYTELWDIIHTRHSIILEVLDDSLTTY